MISVDVANSTDHYGQLQTSLEQGSNSTTLFLSLSGVPIGLEDVTEANLKGYYLNGLRSIGSVSTWSLIISSLLPMLISIGMIGALGAALYYGPTGNKKVVVV